MLPRICYYYSGDLGGTKARILKTLSRYMSPAMEREVRQVIAKSASKPSIKFSEYDWSVRDVFFQGHGGDVECPLSVATR